jgi:hypothetical protein
MRLAKFDLATYNQTKDLSGGPIYGVVEEDIPDIGIIVDEHGNPTRGGLIGYALAYALMAGWIGAMFYIL